MRELEGRRRAEIWLAWIRLAAVPLAIVQILLVGHHPRQYGLLAWLTTAVLAAGGIAFFRLSRLELGRRAQQRLGCAALLFDAGVVSAFILIYHFQRGTPVRQLLYLIVVEAALRYGIVGPIALALATAPLLVLFEHLRAQRFSPESFQLNYVTLQVGVEILMGVIVGWLVRALRTETGLAEARAAEAEGLRDQLGRRVDLLEAANRCVRALGSSLALEQAFNAFIRELQGLIPFDRVAIILEEASEMRVIAAAGVGVEERLPPGTILPRGALVEEVISTARTIYRPDMTDQRHPEEADLLAIGLRCRLVAPLLSAARPTGMLALLRREPDSFRADEVELVTLLGRLAGTAVQNIRAYDAERRTVEELRRLSALRADFVSLVSHELRSPMAVVIGAAETLRTRGRELTPEQRESFLALIGDETNRLASLVGDVLDTSRIEAGTFSYSFGVVELGQLVRETVAAVSVGQDEIRVDVRVEDPLPLLRGDRERLRQVLLNLIENAVKYSPTGGEVMVTAHGTNGRIYVEVADQGPGIAHEDQGLIFEKFGRAHGGQAKPGSGLGLFIARSIAESHGGTLEVRSAPDRGATFSLELPV